MHKFKAKKSKRERKKRKKKVEIYELKTDRLRKIRLNFVFGSLFVLTEIASM